MFIAAVGRRQLVRSVIVRQREPLYPQRRRLAENSKGAAGNGTQEAWRQLGTAAASAAIAILGGAFGAQWAYRELILSGDDIGHAPRRDRSRATVLLRAPTPPRLADVDDDNEGGKEVPLVLREVDATEFESFVTEQQKSLVARRKKCRDAASTTLRDELLHAFADASDRVKSFADWYFSYSTSYKLLGLAMASAAKHAVSFRTEKSLAEAVSHDMQSYVCGKYEAIVLRPASTDPLVHRAFVRSLRQAHEEYITAAEGLEANAAAFFERNSAVYATPPTAGDVIVSVDWSAQLRKVEHVPVAYERTGPGLKTVALVGGGAAIGKMTGVAAMGVAAKSVVAKITAPFAAKAVSATLGSGAAVGAASGAAAAGPAGAALGAAAGAAMGLGIDVGVNAGVALMQRTAFEKDVRDSLDSTIMEWDERLLPELERVVDVWFDHAATMLDVSRDSSR